MAIPARQATPPNGLHPHHAPPGAHSQMNGHMPMHQQPRGPPPPTPQHLSQMNEAVWISIGNVTELMGDLDGAINAYEQALRHNQYSVTAMNQISTILRTKENFPKAVEYLQAILKLDANNGEVWGSLGHCFLMMEDLQQAYSAYQQALYHLRDPQEPKLWYGIGILYDRYGSLEHAEEAFSQVMRMQPDFEKANEIYFRLGIIYKQQQKFQQSLECFKYIVQDPPRPLTEEDIWFQIGHVHEQQKDYDSAKAAYRRVLERDPNHAKVLQQLGWLHHQQSSSFSSQEQAIEYLEKSVGADNTDAQSWYLLGRCYMSQQKYSKAYEAYQQAVYRDGRNPTFWCSIGVLYYQINQYRDALDAYSRAIRLNPYISEVWYDLGTLYESCNNQISDALDAYQRAAELDPGNTHIKARLQLLRNNQANGISTQPSAPVPQDVHPQHYQAPNVAGPPGPQWGIQAPAQGPPSQAPPPPDWNRHLAPVDAHPPPQPRNPWDQRDATRGPPPPPPPPARQPSPRQEQLRHYQEPPRGAAVRRPSPPLVNHPAANPYAAQPGPSSLQAQQAPPTRISNPNYAPQPPNGMSTPPAGHHPAMPPPGRGHSPGPEIKPIQDDRVGSPAGGLPHMHIRPHLGYQPPPMTSAPSYPPSDVPGGRDRDDRPGTGFKRTAEPEDEYRMPNKKPANGENRSRLEDDAYHRGSPKDRQISPGHQRRSSSEVRREQANRDYHPSEAAHHPPTLPALQQPPQHQQLSGPPQHHQPPQPQSQPMPPQQPEQPPQQSHLPPMSEAPREERREAYDEAPRRKMDVDEDYDDAPEDEKRGNGSNGRSSPLRPLTNGQVKADG